MLGFETGMLIVDQLVLIQDKKQGMLVAIIVRLLHFCFPRQYKERKRLILGAKIEWENKNTSKER